MHYSARLTQRILTARLNLFASLKILWLPAAASSLACSILIASTISLEAQAAQQPSNLAQPQRRSALNPLLPRALVSQSAEAQPDAPEPPAAAPAPTGKKDVATSSPPIAAATPPPQRKWVVDGVSTATPSAPSALLKSTITAQEQTSLTITEALDEALLKSPRAAAIRATLGIARSGYAAATVQRNPNFFFDRGLVAEAERRIGPTLTWTPPWQIAFDLLVAKRQVDQAKLEILRDLWMLRADVRRAYTEVVIAQETAQAVTALLDLADKTEYVATRRFESGAVPEFDVLKARLSKEQALLDLHQAQRRVIKSKQHLNLILGRLPKQPVDVAPLATLDKLGPHDYRRNYFLPEIAEEVPDLELFLQEARKHRWDIKVIEQQIRVNKASLQNSWSNVMPIPQLILGQSVSGNQPSGPSLAATFFTINAEVPLTNWQQGDITKFAAIGKQLKWQIGAVRNQVDTDVSAAYQDLLTYRERIKLYQEHVLADSLETARLSRRSYEVGHSDITGVIQSQQANFQIQLQYISDIQAYQQAFIDLEQAVGRPLQ